jgi:lipopolysaccharide export system protein LptA
LLGSAVFLVLMIAAFIGYARLRARFHHLKLPGNLGVNIVRESGGWTLSRAAGSRTLYTIHAAKVDQQTNGKIALHDVWIVLYGKKGDRRDHITGQDFEYDEKAGVVRAIGVVHLDLQAAEPGKPAYEVAPPEESDTRVLHVKTSGLVYLEKLGVAATSDYIEFESGAMKGHATGADYSSDSGMLMLHSAVSMSGIAGGRPVNVTAATAEFDERNEQGLLTHARYDSEGRTAEAEQATVYRRADGTLERVLAQGNVTIQEQGATVVSQRTDVMLNAASQPQSALLTGNVAYTLDKPLRQARGTANEARIAFDGKAKPQPKQAVFTGAVHLIERTRASEAVREPWSVRDLTSDKFVAGLAPAGNGQVQLRDAEATGSAHLILVDNGSLANSKGGGRTDLSADDLKGLLTASGDAKSAPQLDTLTGRGHTVLRQLAVDGVEQTSTGDTLDAKFRPRSVGGRASGNADATLRNAVQQGHVTLVRRMPAKAGTKPGSAAKDQEDIRRAVAQRASYDGDTNSLTLTGAVQMMDAGSVLWANQVAMDRATGDAQAVGGVKVDYDSSQGGGKQSDGPTHIVAERADLEHATSVTTFHGKPVRMWQGASQVQAPVIEVSSEQKRLIARGESATGWAGGAQPAQVHTVLTGAGGDATATPVSAGNRPAAKCGAGKTGTGKSAGGTGTAAGASQAVRIASGGLIYSGILRQADFTGGVRADTADATIRAGQATAYLEQATKDKAPVAGAGVPSLAGNLERVIATEHVDITRTGLQATGERLVYSAGDQVFLLTGTPTALPKAVDARGTTTGAALRFDTCDDSVEALGAAPGSTVQRVRTETHLSNDKKKEKERR